MNLSKNEATILSLLREDRELYGSDMVKKSGGKLKLGTIYITLGQLEEKGLITSRRELEPQLMAPRRLYMITGTGTSVYNAWASARNIFGNQLVGDIK